MTDERDPMRFCDAGSDCDPVLRRVLGNAQRSMSGAEGEALAQRIEQAVQARVIAEASPWRTLGPSKWLVGVGVAALAAAWFALREPSIEAAAAPRARTGAMPPSGQRVVDPSDIPLLPGSTAGAPAARRIVAAEPPVEHAADGTTLEPVGAEGARDTVAPPERAAGERATERGERASRKPSAARRARGATQAVGTGELPEQTSVPPELELLAQAQRALHGSPATALELAEQHARAYAGGRFVQERESIAIEALFALGRQVAARDRAHAFIARFPQSVQAARLRSSLEHGGH